MKIGRGYIGSSNLQTSTANQEIIPSPPSHWTLGYNCYKLSFFNSQDCTVKINNLDPIYLQANQGFEMDKEDSPITSFVIIESGVGFNWIGAY